MANYHEKREFFIQKERLKKTKFRFTMVLYGIWKLLYKWEYSAEYVVLLESRGVH